MARLVREFGFETPDLSEHLFLQPGRMVRMGVEPVRIEILTEISGCNFEDCFAQRLEGKLDGEPVNIISLRDLIKNKRASGRLRDLDDADKLEKGRLPS